MPFGVRPQCSTVLAVDRESAVGLATIRRAENSQHETSMTAANDLAVRRALEAAGVELDENGSGPGVCLRKAQQRGKRK
jgi:hypothetical protein